MGIKVETITTYLCDRCEQSSVDPLEHSDQCGSLSLKWLRSNGESHIDNWLCGDCTEALLAFLDGARVWLPAEDNEEETD